MCNLKSKLDLDRSVIISPNIYTVVTNDVSMKNPMRKLYVSCSWYFAMTYNHGALCITFNLNSD